MTTVQVVAEKKSRRASELRRIARRSEEVAESTHGLDDVDAELPANAPDEDFDRVGITIEVLVVEMLDQFTARNDTAGVVHEIGKQAIFVRGQLDRIAVDGDPAGAGIEAHAAAIELALGVAGRTTQQGADARQDFLEMERLRDIVVGAGVETLDLIAPTVARGQDQDRHGPSGPAPRLEHRDAIHFGQADIEDDRVIRLAFAEKVTLFAIEGTIDHVARVGKCGRELPVEIGIVLDDEEAQSEYSH